MSKQIAKKEPTLKDFPPKLRKLAKFMIENTDYESKKDACLTLGLNPDNIYTYIHRFDKKSPVSFDDFVSKYWKRGFNRAKPYVRNSLVQGAINGAGKHQELYWKLSGEMVEKHEHTHEAKVQFIFSAAQIPQDIIEEREKEGKIIDVTPND